MTEENLDQLLQDEEQAKPLLNEEEKPDLNAAEPEPTPEPKGEEQEEEEPEKESEPEKEASPASNNPEQQGQYEAMIAERIRRQNAENELQQLRSQLEQQPEKPIELDPYGNPEDFGKSMTDLVKKSAAEAAKEAALEAIRTDRAQASEVAMIERLGEAEANRVVHEFQVLASDNPALTQGIQMASDPGAYVEKQVKNARAMKEIGNDPAAFAEKMREQIKAEILAEQNGTPAKETLPKTLANSGTAAPKAEEVSDDSLKALLGED